MNDQHFAAEGRDFKDFLAEGREDGLGDRDAALPDAETREGHFGSCDGREWLSEASGPAGALTAALLANGPAASAAGSGGGGTEGISEKAGAFGGSEAALPKGGRKRHPTASHLDCRKSLKLIVAAYSTSNRVSICRESARNALRSLHGPIRQLAHPCAGFR